MSDNNEQLESEILANLITYPEVILKIKTKLPLAAFRNDLNKRIYEICCHFSDTKKAITKGSLSIELDKQNEEGVDWETYLGEILMEATTEEYLEKLVDILIEKYRTREMINVFNNINEKLSKGTISSNDVYVLVQNELLKLATMTKEIEFRHIKQTLEQIEEIAYVRQKSGGLDIDSYSTGYRELSKILHGFKPGQLIIIAGRPSMGKTTLALNIVANFAQNYPKENIIVVSREVGANQLVLKMIAAKTENSTQYIESGHWLNTKDTNKQLLILNAIDEYKKANIYFDDTFTIDINTLYGSMNSFKKNGKIGLIIIDYLQLLEDKGTRMRTRENEVAKVSRMLKKMALEFNCPVVAVSQLGRRSEQRKDRKPILSDLRESGAIEQDADVVILLHSEDKTEGEDGETVSTRTFTDLEVAKNRDGPTGLITLLFLKQFSKFSSYSEGEE